MFLIWMLAITTAVHLLRSGEDLFCINLMEAPIKSGPDTSTELEVIMAKISLLLHRMVLHGQVGIVNSKPARLLGLQIINGGMPTVMISSSNVYKLDS